MSSAILSSLAASRCACTTGSVAAAHSLIANVAAFVALFRQDRDRDTVFDDVLTLDPVCELRVPLSQRFLVRPFFQLVDDVFVIVDANGRDG